MNEIAYVTTKMAMKHIIVIESPLSFTRHSIAMIKLTNRMMAATHDITYVHEKGGSNPCFLTRAFFAAINQDSVMKEVYPDGTSDFGGSSCGDVANGGDIFYLSGSVLDTLREIFLFFSIRAELVLIAISSFRSPSWIS